MNECCKTVVSESIADWYKREHAKENFSLSKVLSPLPDWMLDPHLHIRVFALSPEGGKRNPLIAHKIFEKSCPHCNKEHAIILLDARLMLLVFYTFTQSALLRNDKKNEYRKLTDNEIKLRNELLDVYIGSRGFSFGTLNELGRKALKASEETILWALSATQLFHHWSLAHEIFHKLPAYTPPYANDDITIDKIIPTQEELTSNFYISEDTAQKWIEEFRADIGAVKLLYNSTDLTTHNQFSSYMNRTLSNIGIVDVVTSAWLGLHLLLITNPKQNQLEESGHYLSSRFNTHPPLRLRRDLIGAWTVRSAMLDIEDTGRNFTQLALKGDAPPPILARLIKQGFEQIYKGAFVDDK